MLLHIGLVNRHRFAGAVRDRVADVIIHHVYSGYNIISMPRPEELSNGIK